jgi:serine/threonine protein kinase
MAEPAPGRAGEPDSHPDATLLPESGAPDGHDATQVRTNPAAGGASRPGAGAAYIDGTVAGYELLDELGRGGMGVVYKARQRGLNRPVALKMVLAGAHARPEDLARFRAEAEVVAHLQHPNIVQIYEIGEQVGRPFLALELVTGGTLQKRLAGTPQPVRPAAHLVEVLARAIHFAHQRGIVHRDLKPGNVLLAPAPEGGSSILDPDAARVAALYGVPKVTDFGLAKRLEDDAQHTRSGDILGTPSYMAPEQAGGQAAAAGPATDVYALGAILYELLTGRAPFKGATTFETIQQVRTADPVPPGRLRPRLPRDLERICLKCLEKDPRRRYATALDLAADLRRHLNGESVHARAASPVERLWRWSRRNPVPAGLILAITLGAGLGFWHLTELSQSLVRSTALEGAAQQAETLDEVNRYYGRVAAHLNRAGVKDEYHWDVAGKLTMPPPATLTIDLGQQITARSKSGVQVRLYSDYPFRHRTSRPPPDDFEREALAQLRRDPGQPYYRFEDLDGRPVLRFATARVMKQDCADCHNNHPDRNTEGPLWKEGDVRGVLEIVRPLDRDRDRVHQGLRSTVLIVAGSGTGLLGLSVFLIYLGNRRGRVTPVADAPAPAEADAAARAAGTEVESAPAAGEPAPDTPPEAATPPTAPVPAEQAVVWAVARPIGTLTPVRIVVPADGVLRLGLSEGENPVELRVDVEGVPAAVGSGTAPFVEVLVQAGAVVVVRVRGASSFDARSTLSVELLGAGG